MPNDSLTMEWLLRNLGPWGLMAGAVIIGCRAGCQLLVGILERFLSLSVQFAADVRKGFADIGEAIRGQELRVEAMQGEIEKQGIRIDHLAGLVQQHHEQMTTEKRTP